MAFWGLLVEYTSGRNAAISFLLGHIHLQVVITAVGIGHFLGGGSAFDEAEPSYMHEVTTRYSKAETVLLDCIFEHYISSSASNYYVNPPRPLTEAREPSEKVAPAESSDN